MTIRLIPSVGIRPSGVGPSHRDTVPSPSFRPSVRDGPSVRQSPSVRPSVSPSVRPSVRLSVHPSVCLSGRDRRDGPSVRRLRPSVCRTLSVTPSGGGPKATCHLPATVRHRRREERAVRAWGPAVPGHCQRRPVTL